MSLPTTIWRAIAAWFDRAIPASFDPRDAVSADNRRRSIHDVTIEQLGIAHRSCHTHF